MTRPNALLALLLTVTALAGCSDDGEAATRIVIDFPAPHADVDDQVPLAASQEAAGADLAVNARHQLLAWSLATGTDVDIREFSFGHCLDAIDHVPPTPGCDPGAAGYWALSLNGEASQVGMDEVVLDAGDVVTWTYTPLEGSASSADAPVLAVEVPAPTQNESMLLEGTVDRAARISAGPLSVDANGPWSIAVPLEFGQNPVLVIADDGKQTTKQEVVLVRLAPATMTADFTSAVPPRPSLNDTIWLDVDAFLSAPAYAGKTLAHPPHANVHDALVAWVQAGRAVEFSYNANYGFGLESIEGHGALSEWCYDVNGESASLGITGQEFRPGDTIAWHSCIVV